MFLFWLALPVACFMVTVALGIIIAAIVPDRVINKVLYWIEK